MEIIQILGCRKACLDPAQCPYDRVLGLQRGKQDTAVRRTHIIEIYK
jgi:hypothetical protein